MQGFLLALETFVPRMRCNRCRYPFLFFRPNCPRCTARRRHYYLILSLFCALVVSMGILAALETI